MASHVPCKALSIGHLHLQGTRDCGKHVEIIEARKRIHVVNASPLDDSGPKTLKVGIATSSGWMLEISSENAMLGSLEVLSRNWTIVPPLGAATV